MTTLRPGYREYVSDEDFAAGYTDYQRRYLAEPRESDRVLIGHVAAALAARRRNGARPRVLDIGCSTGNLMRHLARALPDIEPWGGELMPEALDVCRTAPDLDGMTFAEMDLLDIGHPGAFDVIVINAVLYLLGDDDLRRALSSVAAALAPGGSVVAFDLFHPFDQHLTIREASATHPDGLVLHLRPYALLGEACAAAGLGPPAIHPFAIPIDLPRPERDDEIISYTVPTAAGERLLFRGALAQPWCHVVASLPG
jgi:SAM-dependent methyltransferase